MGKQSFIVVPCILIRVFLIFFWVSWARNSDQSIGRLNHWDASNVREVGQPHSAGSGAGKPGQVPTPKDLVRGSPLS